MKNAARSSVPDMFRSLSAFTTVFYINPAWGGSVVEGQLGMKSRSTVPLQTVPHQVVHEHPGSAVDGRRPHRLQSRLVDRAGVTLVGLEVVSGELSRLGSHQTVPGDLGQDGR